MIRVLRILPVFFFGLAYAAIAFACFGGWWSASSEKVFGLLGFALASGIVGVGCREYADHLWSRR